MHHPSDSRHAFYRLASAALVNPIIDTSPLISIGSLTHPTAALAARQEFAARQAFAALLFLRPETARNCALTMSGIDIGTLIKFTGVCFTEGTIQSIGIVQASG